MKYRSRETVIRVKQIWHTCVWKIIHSTLMSKETVN